MKSNLTLLVMWLFAMTFVFNARATMRHHCPPENLFTSPGEATGSVYLHWSHPTPVNCAMVDGFEVMVRTCINNQHTTVVYYINNIYMLLEMAPGATCQWKVRSISHYQLSTERHSMWARGPDIGEESGRTDPWNEEDVFNQPYVFPNPVYNNNMTVQINSSQPSDLHIQIMSLTGQTVYDETFLLERGSNYGDIDMAGLGAGVYFVRVSNGYKTYTEKIIKL